MADESSQVSMSLPALDSQAQVETLKQELLNMKQVYCGHLYGKAGI